MRKHQIIALIGVVIMTGWIFLPKGIDNVAMFTGILIYGFSLMLWFKDATKKERAKAKAVRK